MPMRLWRVGLGYPPLLALEPETQRRIHSASEVRIDGLHRRQEVRIDAHRDHGLPGAALQNAWHWYNFSLAGGRERYYTKRVEASHHKPAFQRVSPPVPHDLIQLPLAGPTALSTELAAELNAADDFAAASLAASTRAAYADDWRHFNLWCHQRGLQHSPRGPSAPSMFRRSLSRPETVRGGERKAKQEAREGDRAALAAMLAGLPLGDGKTASARAATTGCL